MGNQNHFNKDDIKKGLILSGALCIVVLFYLFIGKIGIILHFLGKLLNAMSAIIAGCVIAFLINPIENMLETAFSKLFAWISRNKTRKNHKGTATKAARNLAVAGAIIIFLALIIGFLWILIPQLRDSILKLYDNIPSYIKSVEKFMNKFLKNNKEIEKAVSGYLDSIETNFQDIITKKLLPNMDTIIKTISNGIVGGVKFISNFIIGIIVAIYIQSSKHTLGAQCKKVIYAVFNKERGNKVLYGLERVNGIFGGFINGKIVDSVIIGLITAVFCNLVSMPYAVLISVIVGVTNIIPFFGPVIGAVPSALLVLVDSPKMCVVFVIFVIILQQIDGNIIGPLILGDSTGLSGLWVLFSILVGGNLFGFTGMLLGVPVFACIYALFTVMLRDKLKKRKLVNNTDFYINLRGFDKNGNAVHGPKIKKESAKAKKKRMKNMERLQWAENMIGKVTHVKNVKSDNTEISDNAETSAEVDMIKNQLKDEHDNNDEIGKTDHIEKNDT